MSHDSHLVLPLRRERAKTDGISEGEAYGGISEEHELELESLPRRSVDLAAAAPAKLLDISDRAHSIDAFTRLTRGETGELLSIVYSSAGERMREAWLNLRTRNQQFTYARAWSHGNSCSTAEY